MIDLFTVASSGLNASSQLLNTAGKNIANVNTPGYIRERTYHVTQELGGVGRATTERVLDTFAQDQHRRDVSVLGLADTFASKTNQVDNIFANEANSLSGAMSRFFGAMQTATDEPTNVAARQLVLGQAESMMGQFATMEKFLNSKQDEINDELTTTISRANELIQNISTLNNQIRTTQFNNQDAEPGALKNQLDQSILELAELTSIHTRDNGDGTTLVNLTSGQSLVLEDGSFNLFELTGDPDLERRDLTLATPDESINIQLAEPNVGGKIGGLFKFRDEVLEPTRREIGQIALSMTDALNQQNRLGMDLDGQLGSNIFTLPTFQSLNYANNSAATLLVNGRVSEGGHSSLTSADYQVTIDAVNAGPTLDVTVAFLNPDGSPVLDTSGNPITQTLTGVTTGAGNFTPVNGGIELEFPNGGAYAVGDRFLMQPTKEAAAQIEVSMTRPEDLALASPIRIESDINNLGDVTIINSVVSNTNVDTAAPFDANASAFDGAGGISNGVGVGNAPARIVFTSPDTFEVQDAGGAVITTVAGATNLDSVMAQAQASGGWPFGAFPDYPGYDFSIQGVPKAGDTFNINFNTNGTDDNRNGLALSDLQSQDTMVRDSGSGSSNLISFQEAYSTIVSDIGETAATAQVSQGAATAIERQSRDLFESTSGVNLDEEAANLIRFQQAYSASARVLSTAQSLFETILSSVG
ncbi:flagellar hook-associated protein FlgK [Alteromonas sp. a30]|uniref:flagellar hook-associated protein FlgK n=1 Tax=Alteromonas sp. a30 TaxID=2730917 RepID=UPI002280FA96|nr:flagellar hook-associated protein FlgK [Alteromonas sp. a30]MCY7294543.1 flagellar hook-associated protein FlgK [Alteromonas sp. a30]